MREYTTQYIENLKKQLIEICTSKGVLNGEFMIVEELDELWELNAPEYLADAVKEIAAYPTVSIAWACYFGMGTASLWDVAWDTYKHMPQVYLVLRDKRGFDCLDEYVCEELLGLEEQISKKLANIIGDCSMQALSLLRKEQIEPLSVEAVQLFHVTTRLFFQLGISLELYRMGYKYEKIVLN